jgi:hypothetical protein
LVFKRSRPFSWGSKHSRSESSTIGGRAWLGSISSYRPTRLSLVVWGFEISCVLGCGSDTILEISCWVDVSSLSALSIPSGSIYSSLRYHPHSMLLDMPLPIDPSILYEYGFGYRPNVTQ